MDIDLLSKMIKELILDNDKVVLPGLGAFVAEVVPSTFSDKGYTINPPYRRLYFRSRPDEGGGLVDFYSASNKVDREIADKVVRDFVSELKEILFTRKTVIFPGLGRLRATRENAVFFVADEDLDIYPEGFALEPISLKTHVETKDEVRTVVEELKSMVEEPAVEVVEAVGDVPENVAEEAVEEVSEEVAIEVVDEVVEEIGGKEIRKAGFWKKFTMAFLVAIAVAALLLVAFVMLARYMPDTVDRILYTPEELEIING